MILDSAESIEYLRRKGLHLDLSAHVVSKVIARYDLFNRIVHLPGDIIECGVYRGASLFLWASLLEIFAPTTQRKVVGFDTFDGFGPNMALGCDRSSAENLMSRSGQFCPRTRDEVMDTAKSLSLDKRIELVAGDATATIPEYVKKSPGLRVALINLDFDVYDPTIAALRSLYPKLVPGGVVTFDQYGAREWGESDAADQFFGPMGVNLESIPWASSPQAFVVKNGAPADKTANDSA
jgi:hypothetical protein